MPNIIPFEDFSDEYDQWFDRNQVSYESELMAVKKVIPDYQKLTGIEIGAGTGRFSVPLGIKFVIEPSKKMSDILLRKSPSMVISGTGENLPLKKGRFDFVLMVTTVCFLDDIFSAFSEAFRILKQNGRFILAFIDKNSIIGQYYQEIKEQNRFYSAAKFYSMEEVIHVLKKSGFYYFKYRQTLFQALDQPTQPETSKDGYGEGAFVVIDARKELN